MQKRSRERDNPLSIQNLNTRNDLAGKCFNSNLQSILRFYLVLVSKMYRVFVCVCDKCTTFCKLKCMFQIGNRGSGRCGNGNFIHLIYRELFIDETKFTVRSTKIWVVVQVCCVVNVDTLSVYDPNSNQKKLKR